MPFFSKVFKHKDDATRRSKSASQPLQSRSIPLQGPRFISTWDSLVVEPTEVEELIHACTLEMKSRAEALDTPFLLLPFRPDYDSNASKAFIRNYFASNKDARSDYTGHALQQELRLSGPEVLCSIIKWCWARLPDGVVSWKVYEMFRLGESESGMLRTAFDTFVPLSTSAKSSSRIIYDFFDLLAAIAAHGKVNGLSGTKLSRLAGWWAFAPSREAVGFEAGYKHWAQAADACSHMFFAYLRSRAPDDVDGTSGISSLPRSLQALVAHTEYPPKLPSMMQSTTSKVVMIVESVSPDPFALLRRANHFEYRDQDSALQLFADYGDPIDALTEECRRVLEAIASANRSVSASGNASVVRLPSGLTTVANDGWSRFQDQGFAAVSSGPPTPADRPSALSRSTTGLSPMSRTHVDSRGRPTTPSWADYLTEGMPNAARQRSQMPFLPPSKSLPMLSAERFGSSSGNDADLEPGELASITSFKLDDAFWWVWMTSLASEEPANRKAAFGRCTLIETLIPGGRWLVMEEQYKGASAAPDQGAYMAEKKPRFGFRRKSSTRKSKPTSRTSFEDNRDSGPISQKPSPSANVSFDQQLMIKAAAVELARKSRGDKTDQPFISTRRGRFDDASSVKTNSMLTLGMANELQPALKWANSYDKEAIRRQYLGNNFATQQPITEDGHSDDSIHQVEHALTRPTSLPLDTDRALPDLPGPLSHANVQTSTTNIAEPHSVEITNNQTTLSSSSDRPIAEVTSDASQSAFKPLVDQPAPAGTNDVTEPDTVADIPEQTNRQSVHPAFRDDEPATAQDSGEIAAQIGARAAWQKPISTSPPSSPPRTDRKAAKNPTGSLRKMFSRKKGHAGQRSSEESTSSQASGNAAARSQPHLRKDRPISKSTESQASTSASPPVGSTVPAYLLPAGAARTQQASADRDTTVVAPLDSPIGTIDQDEANEHFSRFDQGMPVDSVYSPSELKSGKPMSDSPKDKTDYLNARPPMGNREESVYVTPLEPNEVEDTRSPISNIVEEDESSPAAQQDPSQVERWAQIRRNVAVRTNTQDDIHEMPSSGTATPRRAETIGAQQNPGRGTRADDDGDTSAEETMEERLTRIKARVAHLTGDQTARQTPRTVATHS